MSGVRAGTLSAVTPMPAMATGAARLVARTSAWLTRRSVVPVALAMTLLVGFGDRVTGVELPFTMLYVVPIGLGTWYRDRTFGSLLSGLATMSVVVSVVHDYSSSFTIVWNAGGASVLFFAVTWLTDRLRAYVARGQAERQTAVDQLRHAERLNVIGTLAAGVAHELGTPLNVIGGCAEMLAEESADAGVHRSTRMIIEQTQRISAIIRHLLEFGRRGGIGPTRVELDSLLATTTEMLQPTARQRGSSIVLEPGTGLALTACAPELGQVVSNLILNGLQAMPDGGRVRVWTEVGERPAADGRVQRVACIAVEDQGLGIAPGDLARIFDPFFTTKPEGEGTGLGLSVSYGIVRDHGGSIEVESVLGRGSQFVIVLPLA